MVLNGLTRSPFETMIPIKELTIKTLFLVAITSARRVSELGALSINPNLCTFHKDRVFFCPDPAFLPKINTLFHREQETFIHSFCPHPHHPKERKWDSLDVRKAIRFYTEQTKSFRKTGSFCGIPSI